jgi:hypothetical protein
MTNYKKTKDKWEEMKNEESIFQSILSGFRKLKSAVTHKTFKKTPIGNGVVIKELIGANYSGLKIQYGPVSGTEEKGLHIITRKAQIIGKILIMGKIKVRVKKFVTYYSRNNRLYKAYMLEFV